MENTNEIAESDLPNDIKNLTAVEARNWLSYTKPWTLEQATLIFAGHSPKSRYFFKDDGASGFWLAFNFWHRFKSLQKDSIPRSQNEWLELAERESWPLPDPLIEAMSSESKNNNLQPKFESALERQSRRYQMCLGLGIEVLVDAHFVELLNKEFTEESAQLSDTMKRKFCHMRLTGELLFNEYSGSYNEVFIKDIHLQSWVQSPEDLADLICSRKETPLEIKPSIRAAFVNPEHSV
jgi:hypothetical protein